MKNLQEIFNFEQFDNLEMVSKQVVEGFITGMHRSPYHGFSVEFAEHRLYNQGESTKHIDWKLFARSEKLFVKKYEEETNLRCMLVVDTSSSMLFPFDDTATVNKLAFSVYSAAALTHILRRQRDAVGLTLFSDHLEVMTDMKLSESHSKRIFTELNQCLHRTKSDFNKGTHLAETLHLIAEKIHKRSLVVLFTDMFTPNNEQLFPALEHLRYNKHEVILFHVTDKKLEQELAYPNRPLKFVDMETGQVMKLNPNDLRKDYAKSYQAFLTGLKLKCGQNNIDLAEADVNEDFQNVLVPFLVKRESLY
ncbi:MAG TPA: DUF58 domain-containing protein [Marinilabiliales bacterium]|nr:MAG: hypothetical protein A2W96_14875 [Bacteroidetes bacterium GWD2_40_43]OFX91967.1 MAG: hypothetical protein A2W97_15745 [Bacteroidetes bacterium GWE2_40_63]OFY24616.1 MAG: hypothetical protein A2W88_11040 [Bacteroidetes bacterium GWF2_40_13]OFZ26858.1 MAG: hypothetical protein A2437_08205 [Bacteroidetes bacterium RIFOXYC2_FULL_40_12]HAN00359.1 DUF58 domain-containing protein [Marinilabiliales bacterium]